MRTKKPDTPGSSGNAAQNRDHVREHKMAVCDPKTGAEHKARHTNTIMITNMLKIIQEAEKHTEKHEHECVQKREGKGGQLLKNAEIVITYVLIKQDLKTEKAAKCGHVCAHKKAYNRINVEKTRSCT